MSDGVSDKGMHLRDLAGHLSHRAGETRAPVTVRDTTYLTLTLAVDGKVVLGTLDKLCLQKMQSNGQVLPLLRLSSSYVKVVGSIPSQGTYKN